MKNKWFVAGLLSLLLAGSVFGAGIPKEKITRPEGTVPYQGDRAELLALGETLWNDKSLSNNGKTACASCHKNNTKMFKKTFLEPYPHPVKMVQKKAKLDEISTEGMVQFCMLAPMKRETLAWDSKELAALTAYSEDVVQKTYIESKSK